MRAFVAAVVPCANRVTACAPTAWAAATTDSSCRSPVGTLAVSTEPSSWITTASVNVPPTSIPRMATGRLYVWTSDDHADGVGRERGLGGALHATPSISR